MSPIERPDYACRTCRPPKTDAWILAEHGWRVCDGCFDRLADMLTEINVRFFLLDPRPGGGRSDSRGAPGFGSRSPGSEHVIAMQDPSSGTGARVWLAQDGRVHREDENPPRSVLNELMTFAVDVCECRGIAHHGCVSVPELCRWLRNHLGWIVCQESVVEFYSGLSRLVHQLRPVTGERRVGIGKCKCGARLYAPTEGDTVWCAGCDVSWGMSAWLPLSDQLEIG